MEQYGIVKCKALIKSPCLKMRKIEWKSQGESTRWKWEENRNYKTNKKDDGKGKRAKTWRANKQKVFDEMGENASEIEWTSKIFIFIVVMRVAKLVCSLCILFLYEQLAKTLKIDWSESTIFFWQIFFDSHQIQK